MTARRGTGRDHPRCNTPMPACARVRCLGTGSNVVLMWRSPEAFADQPLEAPVERCDLIAIDRPVCGAARGASLGTDVDRCAGGFCPGRPAPIEAAWVRPRDPWWPRAERVAGPLPATAPAECDGVGPTFDRLDAPDCDRTGGRG